ncbi:FAD binding domain-containing protein [Apiospora arundinis]
MHLRYSVLCGLLSVAQSAPLAPRNDVSSCLFKAGVPFDMLGSVDWARDAAAYNVRMPAYTPVAIAVPTTIPQIQAAVKCGREANVHVSPKAGGHSYISGGLGGENGHLVVQLDRMYNVTLDDITNIATVQPGARLGHMATELHKKGKRAISHGSCPRVGASGHMTSGGYGMSSHQHGLALDFVVGATVVLADGSAVEANATHNSDLFWAIRGAGNNFGIVASWRLRTFEAPDNVTWFRVTHDHWNQSNAAGYLASVEKYINTEMPRTLGFRIADYGSGHPVTEGLYYGAEDQMKSDLTPLLGASGGSLSTYHQVSWMDSIKHYAADNTLNSSLSDVVVDWMEPGPRDNFFAKSLTLNGLNGTAAQTFVDYWYDVARQVTDRKWWFQLDAAGGANSAYAAPGNEATAFAHRDKTFIIQFYDAVDHNMAYPTDGTSLLNDWVANVTAVLPQGSWGAYPNYPDPTLNRSEAQRLYYGDNLDRLRRLKAKYDPEELFYYPQSIEPWHNVTRGSV